MLGWAEMQEGQPQDSRLSAGGGAGDQASGLGAEPWSPVGGPISSNAGCSPSILEELEALALGGRWGGPGRAGWARPPASALPALILRGRGCLQASVLLSPLPFTLID